MSNMQNSLTEAILVMRARYKSRYSIKPRLINQGRCEQFAEDVLEYLFKKGNSGNIEMEDNAYDDYNHCWLEYEGRYYDAETPTGVDYLDNLPIFVRAFKQGIKCNIVGEKDVR